MITAEEMEPAGHVHVNAGRLWAGGVATALVAALAVLAGVLITRGVLGIPVLAPKAASDFGDSSTAVYAGLAAGCALLATALLHVLLLGTPRPFMFFAWITGLADVVAAAAPFTQPAPLASKIFTAIINIVVGVAVEVDRGGRPGDGGNHPAYVVRAAQVLPPHPDRVEQPMPAARPGYRR